MAISRSRMFWCTRSRRLVGVIKKVISSRASSSLVPPTTTVDVCDGNCDSGNGSVGGGESNHRNCYVGRDNITLECVKSQATTPWRRAWPPKFMIKQHRWRQLIIKPDARTVLCLHQSAGGYLWPAAVIGPAERISWIERISRRRLQFLRRPSTRRRWPAAPQLRECNQSDFWRRRRPAPQINLRGRRLFLAAIFRVPFVATKIHTPFLARPSDFSMISIVYSTQQLTKNGSIH